MPLKNKDTGPTKICYFADNAGDKIILLKVASEWGRAGQVSYSPYPPHLKGSLSLPNTLPHVSKAIN